MSGGRRFPFDPGPLRRALIHHGVAFELLEAKSPGRWVIQTRLAPEVMTHKEVRAYCFGLADMRRRVKDLATFHDEHCENEDSSGPCSCWKRARFLYKVD